MLSGDELALPSRKAIRKPGFDYSEAAAYFVTICTVQREPILGDVKDNTSILSVYGEIAEAEWKQIAKTWPNILLNQYVIMPNHIHGIIIIVELNAPMVGATQKEPERLSGNPLLAEIINTGSGLPAEHGSTNAGSGLPASRLNSFWEAPTVLAKNRRPTLGNIVSQFKSRSTKRAHALGEASPTTLWQRNYHDQIIRNERELQAIRQYIRDNPNKWIDDEYYIRKLG